MREEELTVYRDILEDEILSDLLFLRENRENKAVGAGELSSRFHRFVQKLFGFAENRGISGDLWHFYLADILAGCENIYSLATERRGPVSGSINDVVLADMTIIRSLYEYDLEELASDGERELVELIRDYRCSNVSASRYSPFVSGKLSALVENFDSTVSPQDMKAALTGFYREVGAGDIGLNRAFRISDNGSLRPISVAELSDVTLDTLIGYEDAKERLLRNTEAFLSGRPSNNCLLYGDAGTGKSTSVKALANMYFDRGLRIIECSRQNFKDINDILRLTSGRNYRFILFMDDLSFEDYETDYKYLKAVIEGGLAEKPGNVLIYATSNRRHLVKETFSERSGDEVHMNDTLQEKLSLYDRFGITIYFGSPGQKEYDNIVVSLAERNNIDMPREELVMLARRWELNHGGMSGRCAEQFIQYLLGQNPDD